MRFTVMPLAVSALFALGPAQAHAQSRQMPPDTHDGIRALAADPLVRSLPVAEELCTEMAYAHAAYLPSRLIP